MARARRVARQAAIVAAVVVAAWNAWHLPPSTLGRLYAGLAVPMTYLLMRVIAVRVAMEVLP
ncbi:MAG TPA: hypothetical protein VHW65_05830 [Gemmatimonadales bacterium]|jgi:hypothetical protein|nr:hypothetical protein [Gemmatimonadales bacterium]